MSLSLRTWPAEWIGTFAAYISAFAAYVPFFTAYILPFVAYISAVYNNLNDFPMKICLRGSLNSQWVRKDEKDEILLAFYSCLSLFLSNSPLLLINQRWHFHAESNRAKLAFFAGKTSIKNNRCADNMRLNGSIHG